MIGNEDVITNYNRLAEEIFSFLEGYFEEIVPAGRPEEAVIKKTKETFDQLNRLAFARKSVEAERPVLTAEEEAACRKIWEEYLEFAAAYLEEKALFSHLQDRRLCRYGILNCVQMLANLAVWSHCLFGGEPGAFSVERAFGLKPEWRIHKVHSGVELASENYFGNGRKKAFHKHGNGV